MEKTDELFEEIVAQTAKEIRRSLSKKIDTYMSNIDEDDDVNPHTMLDMFNEIRVAFDKLTNSEKYNKLTKIELYHVVRMFFVDFVDETQFVVTLMTLFKKCNKLDKRAHCRILTTFFVYFLEEAFGEKGMPDILYYAKNLAYICQAEERDQNENNDAKVEKEKDS